MSRHAHEQSATPDVPGGFPLWQDADAAILDDAVRMLPDAAGAVAIDLAGDVLHVVCDHVPSPAEYSDWEQRSGLTVTASVAPPAVYAQLQARAEATFVAHAPRAAGVVLREAAEAGASDVSLVTGDVPRMRVSGQYIPVPRHPVLSAADVHAATDWLLGAGSSAQTGVATWDESRWRLATYLVEGRPALSARRLDDTPARLEDLGLPAHVVDLAHATSGLVLVTGPAGSGKTTTVAALVDRINTTRTGHIVTLEHVIEYRHRPRSCVLTQQKVPADVPSFAAGIRAAAGHAPDVIVVADLTDADTVSAALDAAESGHLVIASIAALSVPAAVHRLLAVFDATGQPAARARLADCLRAVVAQALVPTAASSTTAAEMQLVCEVLLANDAARAVVREGRTHELSALLENFAHAGMSSLDRSLALYAASGRIEPGRARQLAPHPDRFDLHYRSAAAARQQAATGPVAGSSVTGPADTRRRASRRGRATQSGTGNAPASPTSTANGQGLTQPLEQHAAPAAPAVPAPQPGMQPQPAAQPAAGYVVMPPAASTPAPAGAGAAGRREPRPVIAPRPGGPAHNQPGSLELDL